MATKALPSVVAGAGGLSRYLEEIRKFPMLEPNQEYILRSWSLVKMGTTAAQKKLFFNLRRMKGQLKALEDGDLRPDQVKQIATKLGVPEDDVVSMNRRLGGDASLNAPVRAADA